MERYDTVFLIGYCQTVQNNVVLMGYSDDPEMMCRVPGLDAFRGYASIMTLAKDGKPGCTLIRNLKKARDAKRLLRAIFGPDGESYRTTMEGFGFYFTEDTERFRLFLAQGREAFCTDKDRAAMYRSVMEGKDPLEVFANMKDPETGGTGTGVAVADVLSVQTGKEFHYYPKDDTVGADGGYGRACVISEEMPGKDDAGNQMINSVYLAAQALGIPEFGSCLRTLVKHADENLAFKTGEFYYSRISGK